jgi:hypothetical protein
MIYMKILKKGGGVVEKRGEEETKSMPHAPVQNLTMNDIWRHTHSIFLNQFGLLIHRCNSID